MTSIDNVTSSAINDYFNAHASNFSSSSTTSTTSTTETTSTTSTTKDTKTSVGKYLNSTSSKDLDAKTIFNKLSIDVGSDGKTITKDELNSYISKAESDSVNISDNELKSLKTLQSKWNTISNGSDSITYANINASGSQGIFTSMFSASGKDSSVSDLINTTLSNTDKIYSSLIESAMSSSTESTRPSTSSLSSMLTTLLTGTTDVNDDANAEMIANLTNLIANSHATHTIETRI